MRFSDLLGLKFKLRSHTHIKDAVIMCKGNYKSAEFCSPHCCSVLWHPSQLDCSIACLSSMTLAKMLFSPLSLPLSMSHLIKASFTEV